MTLDSGPVGHASIPAPWGRSRPHLSLREGSETPLSPRASSCRIGPRRQGFASPLRALDGSGPIRKTRCLRGERGDADISQLFYGISSYGLKGWPMRCHCSSNASTAYCLNFSQYARFPPRLRTAKARTSWGNKMYARG